MLKGLSLLAASEMGGALSRNFRAIPFLLGGAVLLLFGFGFLLDLAHGWLALRMGGVAASGIVAAVLLTLAGILLIAGQSIRNRRSRSPSALTTSALVAAPFAARILGGKLTLGAVLVAGVVTAGAMMGRYLGRE
jgi:hypothetical protein